MRTTRAGQSALLLLDAVGVLAARKIPYAVIGAMAASVHGIVRASMDADAVLSLTIQDTPSLEREFRAAGFQTEVSGGRREPTLPRFEQPSLRHGRCPTKLLKQSSGLADDPLRTNGQ